MKLLTIVIPSYNSALYIDKNMKPFLDERLFKDVEILIINDGSKDETADRAMQYETSYSGYIRLINKENGGHGSALNRGLGEANGKYFKVIDADDWVNTENLVRLVNDLRKNEADVVINPYITINQQTGKELICDYSKLYTLPADSSIDILLKNNIRLALHAITYKTSILQDNNIQFTEKCFYEDFQYDLYPVPYLKTVTILDYPVYWYLIGQKSQSVDAVNALKNVEMYFTVFCDVVEYYEKRKHDYSELLDKYMQKCITIFLCSLYNIYLRNGHTQEIVQMLNDMDARIKHQSKAFYIKTAKRNPYIYWIKNRFVFKVSAAAMKLYKKI